MFEALSDRFDGIFKRLRGRGRLREEDVDEVLREIRLALLEADVNFKVVRNLQARIRERAIGLELSQALKSFQARDYEQCLSRLKEAAKKYPNLPPPQLLLARLFLSSNQPGSARAALEQAAVETPEYSEIYLIFGSVAVDEGRLTDAWLHYQGTVALPGSGGYAR